MRENDISSGRVGTIENDSILWILDFGIGVFHEFFLINFVGASYCRSALQRRLNRSLSRREAAEKSFDLSTGQLSEEFRWDLIIVGAELAAWSARLDVL